MLYEIILIIISMFTAIGITDTVIYLFRRACLKRMQGKVSIVVCGDAQETRLVASIVGDAVGDAVELRENSEILNKS